MSVSIQTSCPEILFELYERFRRTQSPPIKKSLAGQILLARALTAELGENDPDIQQMNIMVRANQIRDMNLIKSRSLSNQKKHKKAA